MSEKAVKTLRSIADQSLSVLDYARELEGRISRMREQRDEALRMADRADAEIEAVRTQREGAFEEAIREYVARQLNREYARNDIADVQFGPGEPWPGTDVTPGDEDYAAIRFLLRQGEKWVEMDIRCPHRPVDLVQACLKIMAEISMEER